MSSKLNFDELTNNFNEKKKDFVTSDQAFNLKNSDKEAPAN